MRSAVPGPAHRARATSANPVSRALARAEARSRRHDDISLVASALSDQKGAEVVAGEAVQTAKERLLRETAIQGSTIDWTKAKLHERLQKKQHGCGLHPRHNDDCPRCLMRSLTPRTTNAKRVGGGYVLLADNDGLHDFDGHGSWRGFALPPGAVLLPSGIILLPDGAYEQK